MNSPATLSLKLFFAGIAAMFFLSGCASLNNPRDPLEPVNRVFYTVNDSLDKAVLKPIATGYKAVLPQFVRTGVTNFFNNLADILTALNNLLQGKLGNAASDVGRVAVNSTVGILGLVDVGSNIGLEKHREDFGQTMGWWGFTSGPYLQLPFWGPSTLRDSLGSIVDVRLNPVRYIWRHDIPTRNSLWGLYFVNLRANLLDASKILDEAALDPYEFQRDAYMQRRRSQVYDGNPPPEKDMDYDPGAKPRPRSEGNGFEFSPRSMAMPQPDTIAIAQATQPSTSGLASGSHRTSAFPPALTEPRRPFQAGAPAESRAD